MLTVAIYVQDSYTLEYNRIELFSDEKISLTSSIQNINDISKTYTDYSQTFTVPASKQNNKIFRHWYDNSNTEFFPVLVKSNAYIEIDTIFFRKGKIQLMGCELVEEKPQNYSITFVGILGNLKDTFNGKYLKDLTSTDYDFTYSADFVVQKVTSLTATSPATPDIAFPLISSQNYWTYNDGGAYDIKVASKPIRYNELFPAIRLRAVLNMIETEFGINFDGTTEEPSTFLNTDLRFTNAFLYLKNADTFNLTYQPTKTIFSTGGTSTFGDGYEYNLTLQRLYDDNVSSPLYEYPYNYYFQNTSATLSITPTVSGIKFKIYIYVNGVPSGGNVEYTSTAGVAVDVGIASRNNTTGSSYYEFYVASSTTMTYTPSVSMSTSYYSSQGGSKTKARTFTGSAVSITQFKASVRAYMPDIKIEDFFSGLLKMFNLTCYSNDGINYTVEQLENYYNAGTYKNITPYLFADKKTLNRVKTYKKINFEYEKSQSIINVNFASSNGVEYGSLFYNTNNDGDEYSIKLPFEDLNFRNLGSTLQVGYCLKTDYQKYIPKPIILYDYNPSTITSTSSNYYLSNSLSTNGTSYSVYRAFGQETIINGSYYGLNFPDQISTLTNKTIKNSLYQTYYENYFSNIYNYKTRLVKINGILPTSILTTIKLNDTIVIKDEKHTINTMTTDLTSGEIQFELITLNEDLPEQTQNLPSNLVEIGTQTWYNINANITTYLDGTAIFYATTDAEWQSANTLRKGAYRHVNNDPDNDAVYGLLYNWYAVMGIYDTASFSTPSLRKTFAPVGFHVPTQSDFTVLKTTFGGTWSCGGALKATGTVEAGTGLWKSPNYGATNSSKFSALPAGYILGGTTVHFGESAYFWSSSIYSSVSSGQSYYMPIEYDRVFVYDDYWFYSYGMSVRLIKD